ncbi:tRNA (adenosine(37)-N6)-threonylcarbamoyltransferase complex transferase subunit TsaD [Patescibacteria group bacterium]|nr:tRNA (adenosine(37)-N6)-threonylcarbamoyltransferase complex transferase subunit TsaD [Patescibacteria group bacterium]
MIILGIETSCDDTAVALVRDGHEVLGSLVSSQVKLHRKFGGIVPEVASRKHLEQMLPLLDELFKTTHLSKDDVDAIAVTNGPGLLGSLLIGLSTAKTLAYVWDKPLIAVDHLIAHIYSNFINKVLPKQYPGLALIVSGGHTELVLVENNNKFKIIGGTRDDAAGEAFDKVAKILGLGYPGGPAIAKVAKQGDVVLPRPMINDNSFDLSFSGLKTALMRISKTAPTSELAYEFQLAITDVLVSKTKRAIRKFNPKFLILSGGVAANQQLRDKILELAEEKKVLHYFPELRYCMDNAAMVALAAYYLKSSQKNLWYNVEVATESSLFTN